MPREFQKIMDKLLQNVPNTFAFIDDISLVTNGNKEDHMKKVDEVFRTLSEAGIRLSENGIRPIEEKFKQSQTS